MQTVNFIVFFWHHTMFSIMCLTLLVRLLMAMMTNTFQSVKKSALLEWRLMIARAVLRHELLFSFVDNERKLAGERGADGKYFHSFLHVQADPDGGVHIPLQIAQQRSAALFSEDDREVHFYMAPSTEIDEDTDAFADVNNFTSVGKHVQGSATLSMAKLQVSGNLEADAPHMKKLIKQSMTMNLKACLTDRGMSNDIPQEGAAASNAPRPSAVETDEKADAAGNGADADAVTSYESDVAGPG
jgi:hypothetical protein